MVDQKAVEWALHLSHSAIRTLKYRRGSQYMALMEIRTTLFNSLPDDSEVKARVRAEVIEDNLKVIQEAGTPW